MYFESIVVLTLLTLAGAVDWNVKTPLDDYIAKPDSSYKWRELASYSLPSCTLYVLNMTSQTWKDDSFSTISVWTHHMTVAIPRNFTYKDAGFLYIGGGGMNDREPHPDDGDIFLQATCELAEAVGVAAGYLKQIPNQPMYFKNDPKNQRRSEDAIIAYTWRKFIEDTSDPEVLLRFPMTKAAIRAMDTVSAVAKQKVPDSNVTRFMVSGASKRGWTAWTTASTDRRVIALAPIVLDCLNFVPNIMHHFQAYGGWSFAMSDYYNENVTRLLDHPNTQRMADIIDPFEYRQRLTMPKMIMSATGDEFFLPDDSHYFFDRMEGPTYMMLMENTNHGITLSEVRAAQSVIAFYKAVLDPRFTLPQMRWRRGENARSGWISLTTDTQPKEIFALMSDTAPGDRKRDFRFIRADNIELIWFDEYDVEQIGGRFEYRVEFEKPRTQPAWRGFLINAIFDGPDGTELDFTTEINIIPDTLPFPRCRGDQCHGRLV